MTAHAIVLPVLVPAAAGEQLIQNRASVDLGHI